MTEEGSAQKIGRYVKYQREKRGMSLQDFANATKLTPSFLSRLESGYYQTVKYTVIEQLSAGFSIPILEFLRKCEVTEERRIILPDFDFYLREKFQFPTEAVDDMCLFLEFIQKKYAKETLKLQAKHKQYWEKRT